MGKGNSAIERKQGTLLFMVKRTLVLLGIGRRSYSKKTLALMCFGMVLVNNKRMDKGRFYYNHSFHMLQCLVFVIRKSFSVCLYRLFFGHSDHPYWSPLDEIVVRTIGFAAQIGEVTAPRIGLRAFAKIQRMVASVYEDVYVREVLLQSERGHDALWITLDKSLEIGSCPMIMYFHGGGYCVGEAGMWLTALKKWLQDLATEQGIIAGILSVEYPLAPEVKFPENLQFAFKAYDRVLSKAGVCAESIILAGDSAGGAMAFAVAQHAKQHCEGDLAGLVLISPWMNHSCETDSHVEHASTDYLSAHPCIIGEYSVAYCDDIDKAYEDPRISALHSDVAPLPPVMLTYGTREVFIDDVLQFKNNLESHGKFVRVHAGDDCPHVHPVLYPLFRKESTRALSEIAAFSAEMLRANNPSP